MQISETKYCLIVRPNGIDAPWEIVDGYEYRPVGFYDTFDDALSYATEMAKRSAFLLGFSCGPGQPEYLLRDFRKAAQAVQCPIKT
jgi:hypothetical protein